MAINLPESLINLPANCGVFAVWMLLQHHGINKNIHELAQACQHDDEEGTFTIALAVALKKMGFGVNFHSAPDPNIDARERLIYKQAEQLHIPLHSVLSYQDIIKTIQHGQLVIVYYDTLEGIGNQSLVHSIDAHEVCFFDSFEPMAAQIFEHQRKAEGICQQAIVIDDRHFQTLMTQKN